MDKKPKVFPSTDENKKTSEYKEATYGSEQYTEETKLVANEVFNNSMNQEIADSQISAVEMMKRRTEQQIKSREETGVVIEHELAETTNTRFYPQPDKKTLEQMSEREKQLEHNQNMINDYQRKYDEAFNRHKDNPEEYQSQKTKENSSYKMQESPLRETKIPSYGENPSNIDPYIIELSQPNYNSPFDMLPLPSEGKLYREKKSNVRVSYMTTADENILTSPNLLNSGDFLEILINRKLLEQGLRYKDLHVGDRNAIMIWLRATGYGEMYPVTLFDENEIPFDTEINLNDLKVKNLGAEPDEDGFFPYQFELSKNIIKFKFLTCGDIEEIDKKVEREKNNGMPINNTSIYTLEKMIVEVNGDRNKNTIREFASNIRIPDIKKFNAYIESIESGIDLNIKVGTPGGGSINTFLPLNLRFFWPNLGL